MYKRKTNLGSTRYRTVSDTPRLPDIPYYQAAPVQHWIISDVLGERVRQDAKWGEQNHPNGTSSDAAATARADAARQACQDAAERGQVTWRLIAAEELAEAFAETDLDALYTEVVQSMAVLMNWAEHLRRQGAKPVA